MPKKKKRDALGRAVCVHGISSDYECSDCLRQKHIGYRRVIRKLLKDHEAILTNKPKLDRKAWERIEKRYQGWFDGLPLKNETEFVNYNIAFSAMKRMVNAELRKSGD